MKICNSYTKKKKKLCADGERVRIIARVNHLCTLLFLGQLLRILNLSARAGSADPKSAAAAASAPVASVPSIGDVPCPAPPRPEQCSTYTAPCTAPWRRQAALPDGEGPAAPEDRASCAPRLSESPVESAESPESPEEPEPPGAGAMDGAARAARAAPCAPWAERRAALAALDWDTPQHCNREGHAVVVGQSVRLTRVRQGKAG